MDIPKINPEELEKFFDTIRKVNNHGRVREIITTKDTPMCNARFGGWQEKDPNQPDEVLYAFKILEYN